MPNGQSWTCNEAPDAPYRGVRKEDLSTFVRAGMQFHRGLGLQVTVNQKAACQRGSLSSQGGAGSQCRMVERLALKESEPPELPAEHAIAVRMIATRFAPNLRSSDSQPAGTP